MTEFESLATSEPKKPRRRVWQNIIYSLLGKGQGAIFSYILLRILLKVMSIEEYGLYSLLFIGVLMNLTKLAQFGIPNLVTRYIPEYYTAGKFRLIHVLFVQSRRFQFVAGIILAIVTILLAPQIAQWINFPGFENSIRLFTLGALSYLIGEHYRMLFSGIFLQRTVFWNSIIYNTVRLVVVALVAWNVIPFAEKVGMFIAIVMAESVMLILSWILFYIAYRRIVLPQLAVDSHEVESPPWSRYTKFSGLSYLNEIGVSLLSVASDLVIISTLIGGVAVGYYGLANRINDLITRVLPGRLLGPVLQPLFYSEYGSAQQEAAFGFNLLTNITYFITLPISIWLAIMSKPVIVSLFDPDYAPAAAVVAITALFLPMVSIRGPLGMMLLNAERIDLIIYTKVFAVAKIAVGFWLVPTYGILGMAWITAIATLAQNVMIYFFIVVNLHVKADFFAMIKMTINGLVSAVIFWFIKDYFNGFIGVILSSLVYGLLFIGMSFVVKAFSAEERAFINKYLHRPLWKF